MSIRARAILAVTAAAAVSTLTPLALAVGESVNGFPNYEERVLHELANRARVDPQLEMTQCGNNCGEAACYTPQPPIYYKRELNRAARFHAAHMGANGYFAHTSSCTLVPNIDSLYPGQCDGEAACSCVGATNSCNPTCSSFSDRVQLFGSGANGEIIASGGGPEQGFYLWLYEPSMSTACQFSQTNGHPVAILTSMGGVGFGADGYFVGDFSDGGEQHKIASGLHWPRQASSVEAWANFNDAAGPSAALVNVDGECTPMALTRGSADNGAYMASLTSVGSGCHRYYYLFKDSGGNIVTFPEAGSLGIGPAASCLDWDMSRPTTGASCDCDAQCGTKECGPDACGGSCGNCAAGFTCSAAGACVPDGGAGGAGGGMGASVGTDTGPGATTGAGAGDGAGGDANAGGDCGCAIPGAPERGVAWTLAGLSLVLLSSARRRQRRR